MGIIDYFIQNPGTNSVLSQETRNMVPSQSQDKIVKPSVTLLQWEAPERLFKKRDKEFYRKIGVIIIFFMVMLVIIKEFLVIIVLGVVFGAVYIFTSVPPQKVVHQITTNGVLYASAHLYPWESLISFFIQQEQGTNMLIINTRDALPGRLILLIPDEVKVQKVQKIVNEYLSIVENPERNVYQDFVKKIGQKINI